MLLTFILICTLFMDAYCESKVKYCQSNSRHGFCKENCMKFPNVCDIKIESSSLHDQSHSQISMTNKDIEAIASSLNTLRNLAMIQELQFQFNIPGYYRPQVLPHPKMLYEMVQYD